MIKNISLTILVILSFSLRAEQANDREEIEKTVLNYIESQHQPSPGRMADALDKKLAKRTYWQDVNGKEFIMETDYATMLRVAETYNKSGNRFPADPKKSVLILDVDQRVATVKLVADDWIDYMHLYKSDAGEWKIINVLWQYHVQEKHRTMKKR